MHRLEGIALGIIFWSSEKTTTEKLQQMESQLKSVAEKLDAMMAPKEEAKDEGVSKFRYCNINDHNNLNNNGFIFS